MKPPNPAQQDHWRELAYLSDETLQGLLRQSPATAARLRALLNPSEPDSTAELLAVFRTLDHKNQASQAATPSPATQPLAMLAVSK